MLYAPQIAEAGAFIPDFIPGRRTPTLWTDAFALQPRLSLTLAVVVIAGFFGATAIQRRTHDRMREVWTGALALPGSTAISATAPADDTLIHRLRIYGAYQGVFRALKWWIVPYAFGLGIVWAGTTLAIRALLSLTGAVLGDRIPELVTWRVMAVGALATLVLIAIAEWPLIWRRLVNTFRRHGGATPSYP